MKTLHEKFVEYGRNAKQWMRKCKLLLPEISRQRIWEKEGFGSIYEYAAKLAGLSRGQVDDALWILKKAENKPELMKVAEEKGLNAIRPIVAMATDENAAFLAEKAKEMSQATLKAYVRELRVNPKKETTTITMELTRETATELEKLNTENWEELMKEFLEIRRRQLESEKPEPKEAISRHIPKNIKTYILKRSRGRCEHPNCKKNYHDLHHTERFVIHHEHNPDKIRALCKTHHDLAHHGAIENETKDPKTWRTRMNKTFNHYVAYIDEQVQSCKRTAIQMKNGP